MMWLSILPLLFLTVALFIGLYALVYSTGARVPALDTCCGAISSPIINCVVWVWFDKNLTLGEDHMLATEWSATITTGEAKVSDFHCFT